MYLKMLKEIDIEKKLNQYYKNETKRKNLIFSKLSETQLIQ